MKRSLLAYTMSASLALLSIAISPADARMGGGGFGGHMGGFGSFGGRMGGMGGFGSRTSFGGASFAMRGPAFAGGFARGGFVGARPFGARFMGHPFAQRAFFRHRGFRSRFALAAFPFPAYATGYDDGCWVRVWSPYGLIWQNYCGYGY
jgi:hypothetical protein